MIQRTLLRHGQIARSALSFRSMPAASSPLRRTSPLQQLPRSTRRLAPQVAQRFYSSEAENNKEKKENEKEAAPAEKEAKKEAEKEAPPAQEGEAKQEAEKEPEEKAEEDPLKKELEESKKQIIDLKVFYHLSILEVIHTSGTIFRANSCNIPLGT